MLKKLVLSALVAVVVALLLSACSGNVADHKANCEEYNKNFEQDESPIDCKAVEQMAHSLVLSTQEARVSGVCLDLAAKRNGGKAAVVKSNNSKYQLKWIAEFGQGYTDCGNEVSWNAFAVAYKLHRITLVSQ
jgi:hypothetical protein